MAMDKFDKVEADGAQAPLARLWVQGFDLCGGADGGGHDWREWMILRSDASLKLESPVSRGLGGWASVGSSVVWCFSYFEAHAREDDTVDAEASAMSWALRTALGEGVQKAVACTDSKSLVWALDGELNGRRRARARPSIRRLARLARRFEMLRIEWLPREQNGLADELARRAEREARRPPKGPKPDADGNKPPSAGARRRKAKREQAMRERKTAACIAEARGLIAKGASMEKAAKAAGLSVPALRLFLRQGPGSTP